MRQFNLTSSGKDIPIPSRTTYMKKLISQTETYTTLTRHQFFHACQKDSVCVYLSFEFFHFELLRYILLTWSDEVH